jgi:type IV pilus assembly protein PilM
MSFSDSLRSVFQDPPPEFAFAISAAGIAMSRTRPPAAASWAALPEGALVASPVKENIVNLPAFSAAVGKLVPASGKRRSVALILPDNAMRLAVLEFESLPEKDEEKMALVRFRLRKTVPFDVDSAAVSFHAQPGNKVVVAVTPAEVIAQYEAPFRTANLHPGVVIPASLALLELLPATGSYLVAHQNSATLTILVVSNGVLTLARSLGANQDEANQVSPAETTLDEVVSNLYATRVYVEDQSGSSPDRLYLAGFGHDSSRVASRLAAELNLETETVQAEYPGLTGYLTSLLPSGKVAA